MVNLVFYKLVLLVSDGCIVKIVLRMFCWGLLLGDDRENFVIFVERFKKMCL